MTNIIIIEDNASNMKLFRLMLSTTNYHIFEANDGESGIDLVKSILPDLILLDIKLPQKDGIEVFHELKGNPITSQIPIIALTSFAMDGDKEKLLGIGFTKYLAKPVRRKDLLEAIESCLNKTKRN